MCMCVCVCVCFDDLAGVDVIPFCYCAQEEVQLSLISAHSHN